MTCFRKQPIGVFFTLMGCSDLDDAGPSRAHRADHVNVGGGGRTMPLQGLTVSTWHGEVKGWSWGEVHPAPRRDTHTLV